MMAKAFASMLGDIETHKIAAIARNHCHGRIRAGDHKPFSLLNNLRLH
jgi:hypothetical protein